MIEMAFTGPQGTGVFGERRSHVNVAWLAWRAAIFLVGNVAGPVGTVVEGSLVFAGVEGPDPSLTFGARLGGLRGRC